MASSEKSSRHSLIPSFFYSSSVSPNSFMLEIMVNASPSAISSNVDAFASMKSILIPAPTKTSRKIEMYSPAFYATCTADGILSCGLTYMAVTPLDLVKCNIQQGEKGFFKGWVPTLLGYSAQGACKFGFYEFLKKYYSDIVGPKFTTKYKTLIYLASFASAKVIADIALCLFEAVKVRHLFKGLILNKFITETVKKLSMTLNVLHSCLFAMILNVYFLIIGLESVKKISPSSTLWSCTTKGGRLILISVSFPFLFNYFL
ncbi:hypothetical protein UlMin_000780 [Ulmus minor]